MKKKWKIVVTLVLVIFFIGIISAGVLLISGLEYRLPFMAKKVAIIPVKGKITTGGCSCTILGCEQCAQVKVVENMLESADKDNSVGAIVLDIKSGGGGVVASTEMMKAVRETEKPVVARVGQIGTSGAYYVASAADKVVVNRNSITGGIGVVMQFQQYYELMDKIGINMTVIKSGGSKDIGSPYRPLQKDEREELQEMVDLVHKDLVKNIAQNRGLSQDYVENVSQGNLYLGIEAKRLNLADEVGDLDKAVEVAGKLGDIKSPKKVRFTQKKGLLEKILGK